MEADGYDAVAFASDTTVPQESPNLASKVKTPTETQQNVILSN